MLGEFLYRLLERDQATIEPFILSRSSTQASSFVTINFQTPTDRILLITGAAVQLQASGTQLAVSWRFVASDPRFNPSPLLLVAHWTNPPPAAAASVSRSFDECNFIVMPNTNCLATGSFTAGATPNTAEFALYGFSIPRGNLSLAAY